MTQNTPLKITCFSGKFQVTAEFQQGELRVQFMYQ